MSNERMLVDEAVADTFVERFVAHAAALVAGYPVENPGRVIGPMFDTRSGTRVNTITEDAVAKGA